MPLECLKYENFMLIVIKYKIIIETISKLIISMEAAAQSAPSKLV